MGEGGRSHFVVPQHSKSVSHSSPSGRHTGGDADDLGSPCLLQRRVWEASASQRFEQQSCALAQTSPNSFSALFGVATGPLVRHPPMGRHDLNPKLSCAHRPVQHSMSVWHVSNVARHQGSGSQKPPEQTVPQHCAPDVQTSPRDLHTGCARQVLPARCPEQHSPSLDAVSPATLHGAPSPAHCPLVHVPEQQLKSAVQGWFAVLQPPDDAWHEVLHTLLQHSVAEEQPLPVLTQPPAA